MNSTPWGFYPHKAEQIAEIISKEDEHDWIMGGNTIEGSMLRLWQTHTKLCVGEWVNDGFEAGGVTPILKWQPALLKPEHLWARQKPKQEDYKAKATTLAETGKQFLKYGDAFEQYLEAQQKVWFEGQSKNDWLNQTVGGKGEEMISDITIGEFARITGTPFNENFVKLLNE